MFDTLKRWMVGSVGLFSSGKPACVRQHSEEDCGAACLATVCLGHGASMPMGFVRHVVGTSRDGTTLLGLKRGAERLGLHARPAKAEASLLDELPSLPLPVICHWQGCHWVVLHGWQGKHLLVGDPAVGLRTLSRQEFLDGWSNGVVLLLEPDPTRFPALEEAPSGAFLLPGMGHCVAVAVALLEITPSGPGAESGHRCAGFGYAIADADSHR